MNIEYRYVFPETQEEKYKLMRFMFDNDNTFIMNTFGYLWESRDWWDKFPIYCAYDCNTLIGIHAYSINTKGPSILKTYYIAVHKDYRGKGIAKKLTRNVLEDNRVFCEYFYVNSASWDGYSLYNKLIGAPKTSTLNEFKTFDYEFEAKIVDLL